MTIAVNSFALRNLFMDELKGRISTQFEYSILASDEKLLSVKKIIAGYQSDPDILFLSNTLESVPKGEFLIKTLKIINRFSKDSIYSNIIENTFLYSNENGWVINKNEAVFKEDVFLNKLLVFENDQLTRRLKDISSVEILPQDTVTRKVAGASPKTYNSIIFVAPVNSKCMILVSINSDRFIDSVYLPEKDNDGHFLITDRKNQLITYDSNLNISGNELTYLETVFLNNIPGIQSKSLNVMNNEYITFFKHSIDTNLKYYMLVPSKLVDKQVLRVNLMLTVTFIFCGVIITLIFYVLKKDIYIPITKINEYVSNLFPDENKIKNDIEHIYDAIEKLHEKNMLMIENNEKQKGMLSELFIRRIVEGNSIETGILAKDAFFNRLNDYFVIYLYLEIYDDKTYDSIWDKIINELKCRIDISCFQINRNEMYCITNVRNNNSVISVDASQSGNHINNRGCSDGGSERLYGLICDVLNDILLDGDIYLVCGLSRRYAELQNVKKAFDESKNSILYRNGKNPDSNIFEYNKVRLNYNGKHSGIQISLAEEMQLLNFINAGDIDNVQCFFKTQYEKLKDIPFIEIREMYKYLFNMAFVIIKHKFTDDKKQEFEDKYGKYYDIIERSLNLHLIRKCVESLYFDIVVQIRSLDNKWETCKIIEYINNNYLENDFCLGKVAEEFNITASYLSTYFKKITGKNFTYYVNNLKVEKAKMLLQSTTMDIKDISDDLGFTNPKHFIRLFKQFEGITPGTYRKLIYKNN